MIAVAAVTVALVIDRPARLVAVLVLLASVPVAVWFAVTRAGRARTVWAALGVVAAAGVVAVVLTGKFVAIVLLIAALVAAGALARYALGLTLGQMRRGTDKGVPVPPARHGVLIMNLKSGGGKAERFRLAEECDRRGIRAVVLRPGDDLLALARDAIDSGADVIGMAGGDGSQALVASVAAEHGVPMVVVPAGTRNHLALDLGIDRDDVVGAHGAYDQAFERTMDLAEVNGRTFVNNVSLGLYATIVRSPEYRDAKRDTALGALPELLGPGSTPSDLRFDAPDGHHDGAHVLQVSNGSYGTTVATMSTRPHLDDGMLGITALTIPDDRAAAAFLAALGTGRPGRYRGYQSWEAAELVVDSSGPVPIGLDGEAIELDPPLRFRVRPGALRVRLATDAIGSSPASRALSSRLLLPDLWRVALGRPPQDSRAIASSASPIES